VVFNLAEGSVNANIDLGGQVNGFVVNASGDFGDIIDLTTQDTANLTSVNNTDKAVVFNLANGSLDAGINLNGQIEGLGLITTGSQDDKVNLIVQDAAQITSPTIDQFSIDFALGKGSLVADLHLSGQVQGLSLQTSGDYSDDFDFVADLTASITSSDNLSRAINVDLGHGAVDADLTVTKDVVIEGLKLVTGTGVDDIKMSLLGTIEKPSSASDSALELRTDGGQDSITVQQAGFVNGMLLKGGDNADDYRLTVAETATGNIKIDDTTATDADSVGNTLVVDTQENGDISDQFLFRDGLLYRYGINQNQRIDYSGFTALSLFTYGGDDNFIFDESNVLVTVNAGAGDDTFQVGQMYQSPRGLKAGLVEEDTFDTILTTQGYLSNGVSANATLIGGDGDDSFTVLSNQASIKLEGGADSDNFLVRSFVLVDPDDPNAPITNINGGDGADYISYAVNAPVRIAGGDGLDSLTIIGTEFADDYVITDNAIYGAGRYTTYEGIEQLIVDALEGNDEFYVFSTPADTAVKIIGGLGSDTVNVGDSHQGSSVEVVADDLNGHNSLIKHSVNTTDGSIVSKTLSANVFDDDEAEIRLIPQSTGNILFEGGQWGDLSSVKYAVALTRPPKGVVSFSAIPAGYKSNDLDGQADVIYPQGVLLNGSDKGVTLLFDKSNWYKQQIITVTAPTDSEALNDGVEGHQAYEIQHSIIEDGALDGDDYDNVEVNPFVVNVVDVDSPSVVVLPAQKQLIVGELNEGQDNYASGYNTYQLVLSKQPTKPVTVNIVPHVDELTKITQLTTVSSITFASEEAATLSYDPTTVFADGETLTVDINGDATVFTYTNSNGSTSWTTTSAYTLTDNDSGQFTISHSSTSSNTSAITLENAVYNDHVSLTPTARHYLWSSPVEVTIAAFDDNIVEGIHYSRINHSVTTEDTAYDKVVVSHVDVMIGDNEVQDLIFFETDGSTAVIEEAKEVVYAEGQVVLDFSYKLYKLTMTGERADLSYNGLLAEINLSGLTTTQAKRNHIETQIESLAGINDTTVSGEGSANNSWMISLVDVDDSSLALTATSQDDTLTSTDRWVFEGTFGLPEIAETGKNNTFNSAQNLDVSEWGIEADTDIYDSETIPHISISGVLEGSADFYKFDVTEEMLKADYELTMTGETAALSYNGLSAEINLSGLTTTQAKRNHIETQIESLAGINDTTVSGEGSANNSWMISLVDVDDSSLALTATSQGDTLNGSVSVHLDIDYGYQENDAIWWRSAIKLFKGADSAMALSHTLTEPEGQDVGSYSYYNDDFKSYEIEKVGTYTIEVNNKEDSYYSKKKGFSWGVPDGVNYELQVSVESHAKDVWAFTPDAVVESNEVNNSIGIGTNIDLKSNWYNFANATIGDESLASETSLNIDSSTPYTTIMGAGDGSVDRYNIEITEAMFDKGVAGFDEGGSSAIFENWLSSAQINMVGTKIAGQLMNTTLVINKPDSDVHTVIDIKDAEIDNTETLAIHLKSVLDDEPDFTASMIAAVEGNSLKVTAKENVAFYFAPRIPLVSTDATISYNTNTTTFIEGDTLTVDINDRVLLTPTAAAATLSYAPINTTFADGDTLTVDINSIETVFTYETSSSSWTPTSAYTLTNNNAGQFTISHSDASTTSAITLANAVYNKDRATVFTYTNNDGSIGWTTTSAYTLTDNGSGQFTISHSDTNTQSGITLANAVYQLTGSGTALTITQPLNTIVPKTTIVDNHDETGNILFSSAEISFDSSTLVKGDTWYIKVGSETQSYSLQEGENVTDLATALAVNSKLSLNQSGDKLNYASESPEAISIWVEQDRGNHDASSVPSATLAGIPTKIGAGQIMEIDFGEAAVNYYGEDWTLTRDNGVDTRTFIVTTSETVNTQAKVIEQFKTLINDSTEIEDSAEIADTTTTLKLTAAEENTHYELKIDYKNVIVPEIKAAAEVVVIPVPTNEGSTWELTNTGNAKTLNFNVSNNDFAASFKSAFEGDSNFNDSSVVVDSGHILIDTTTSSAEFILVEVLEGTSAEVIDNKATFNALPTAAEGDRLNITLETASLLAFTYTNSAWTGPTNYSFDSETLILSSEGDVTFKVDKTEYLDKAAAVTATNSWYYEDATVSYDPITAFSDGETLTVDINGDTKVFTYTNSNGSNSWTTTPVYTLTDDSNGTFTISDSGNTSAITLANAVYNASSGDKDLTTTDAPYFGRSTFTLESVTSRDKDTVKVTLDNDSTMEFTYDGASGSWTPPDSNYTLDTDGSFASAVEGRYAKTYQYTDRTEPSVTNVDLYGKATVSDFSATPVKDDKIQLTINSGTTLTFTYSDSEGIWADSGNYSLDKDTLKISQTDDTQPINIDAESVKYITKATNVFQGQKLTLSGSYLSGASYQLISGTTDPGTTQSQLLDRVDSKYSSSGDYLVTKAEDEAFAYMYNNDGPDLTAIPSIKFENSIADNEAQGEIAYSATQINDNNFQVEMDLNAIRDNFDLDESWTFNIGGVSREIVIKDDGRYDKMQSDLEADFTDYDFAFNLDDTRLTIVKADSSNFAANSLSLVENRPTVQPVDRDDIFDIYKHDFSNTTIYGGKSWTLNIDGEEIITAVAEAGNGDQLPSFDAILDQLKRALNDKEFNDVVINNANKTLEIRSLSDRVVELKANVEGVGALFDLDGVKEEKQLVRRFSYPGIPENADISTSDVYDANTEGSEYVLQTPYLVVYQVTNEGYSAEADEITTLSQNFSPEVKASFKRDIVKDAAQNTIAVISYNTNTTTFFESDTLTVDINDDETVFTYTNNNGSTSWMTTAETYTLTDNGSGQFTISHSDASTTSAITLSNAVYNTNTNLTVNYLKPVAVVKAEDPYLEHVFLQSGKYVVQVGYIESTLFQQSTTVWRFDSNNWFPTTETIDTTTAPFNYSWKGVAPGTDYHLNVSVQDHDMDLDNQTVKGYIRITTGNAKELVGEIEDFVAYDEGKKVNRFTVVVPNILTDNVVTSGSQYEVFRAVNKVLSESDYNDWIMGLSDTYTVALTQQSSTPISITVSDLATASYNSDRAFIDGGVSKQQQTTSTLEVIDTTGTVTVTASDDQIVDGGDLQVFAPVEQRVNSIRGPVSIEGGAIAASYIKLSQPVLIPGETNTPVTNGVMTLDVSLTVTDAMVNYDPNTTAFEEGNTLTVDINGDETVFIYEASSNSWTTTSNTYSLTDDGEGQFTISHSPTSSDTSSITLASAVSSVPGNSVPGNQDGDMSEDGVQIKLADSNVATRDELNAFLEQTGVPTNDYQVLKDYLEDNSTTEEPLKFATFVDESVQKENTNAFDARINDAPYELGFVDAKGNKLISFDVLAVVGNRILLAGDWPNGFERTTENANYYYRPVNRNVLVDESEQVDVINFNNTASPINEKGVLTGTNITGFGMGDDIQIEDIVIPGGIQYDNFEELNMFIGGGNDSLNIEASHSGVTNIFSGIGNDAIAVKTISGHTRINLETDTSSANSANNNRVDVASDEGVVDQIMALLTISGDASGDKGTSFANNKVIINDSADSNKNQLWVTENTITGLDMPSVPEQFTVKIQAEAGVYSLSLANAIYKDSKTLNWNASLAQIKTAISQLSGAPDTDIEVEFVTGDVDAQIKTYRVTYTGDSAGIDMPTITAAIPEENGLAFGEEYTLRSTASAEGYKITANGNSEAVSADATAERMAEKVWALLGDNKDIQVDVTLTESPIDNSKTYVIAVNPKADITDTQSLNIPTLDVVRSPTDTIVSYDPDTMTFVDGDTLTVDINTNETVFTYANSDGSNSWTTDSEYTLTDDGAGTFTINSPSVNIAYAVYNAGTENVSLMGSVNVDNERGEIVLTHLEYPYQLSLAKAEGSAVVRTVDANTSPEDLKELLEKLYSDAGYKEISIDNVTLTEGSVSDASKTYKIEFPDATSLGGLSSNFNTDLEIAKTSPLSARVKVDIVRQGSTNPVVNRVQTIEFNNSDSITLKINSPDGQNELGSVEFDASSVPEGRGNENDAYTWYDELNFLLNPNNTEERRSYYPETNNFSLVKDGNVFTFSFQGEYADYQIKKLDINTDKATLKTRVKGINYYGVDTLEINLGSGDDNVNVRSTAAETETSINAGQGNDGIYITSDADANLTNSETAHGDLHGIGGKLNLEAGGGVNQLYISDFDSTSGDDAIVLTNHSLIPRWFALLGASSGNIYYQATEGNFDNGLVIWTSKGDDKIEIQSVYSEDGSITQLYSNEGDDQVTVAASATAASNLGTQTDNVIDEERRLQIFTQSGLDIVDASVSSMAVRVDGGLEKDKITGGWGDDVLLGYKGDDEIKGQQGSDFISGQEGHDTLWGNSGNDVIKGDQGNDLIRGMAGDDTIIGGEGNDTIFGEDGEVEDQSANALLAERTYDELGGVTMVRIGSLDTTLSNDHITDLKGNNIIIAGFGNDTVFSGSGSDRIIGDNGEINYDLGGAITAIQTTMRGQGGTDTITIAGGNNTVFGGLGNDNITTGMGDDDILGDHGVIEYLEGKAVRLSTDDDESTTAGMDIINGGSGNNRILAGLLADKVTTLGGADIVLGDNGELIYVDGILTQATSTETALGGVDTLAVGDGDNVVIAGYAGDTVTSGKGNDRIIGDNGEINYDQMGVITAIQLTAVDQGGDDVITVSAGNNLVYGGIGQDEVTTGGGADVIMGDNGLLVFSSGTIASVNVADFTYGTKDIIKAGDGNNIIAGATGNDDIEAGLNDDIILGDGGSLTFTAGILTEAASTADEVGDDVITVSGGANVILGGAGIDTISAGSGADILLGDNGAIEWTAKDHLHSLSVHNAGLDGYNDNLSAGDGNNIVAGGDGDDLIQSGDGADWILGDTGEILLTSGQLKSIKTSNEGSGSDNIRSGGGNDLVFGGLGDDEIRTGADHDIVIADTGSVEKNLSARLATVIKNDFDPTLGGADTVYLGKGNDIALGGAGADFIDGEGGSDAILGDFAEIRIPKKGLRDIQSTLPTFGAGDTLDGGRGFDILVGGSGYDIFHGNLKEDTIVGNYARIEDTSDFKILKVVSDPTNREIISESLFDLYGTALITTPQDGLPDRSPDDKKNSVRLPQRTDRALRLMPLLNGEELSRLSDNELKDFLRNLPLLTETNQRHGQSEGTTTQSEIAVPSPEGDTLTTPSEFKVPSEGKQIDGTQEPDKAKQLDDVLEDLTVINKYLKTGVAFEGREITASYQTSMNAPDSDSMAASLLVAANVASKRGWNILRSNDEEAIIQGNLQELRKMQSSQKFKIWQRQDSISKH